MLEASLHRKQFWAMSKGGKLKCPKCGAIVVEDLAFNCSEVVYTCTSSICEYEKEIDLTDSLVGAIRQVPK